MTQQGLQSSAHRLAPTSSAFSGTSSIPATVHSIPLASSRFLLLAALLHSTSGLFPGAGPLHPPFSSQLLLFFKSCSSALLMEAFIASPTSPNHRVPIPFGLLQQEYHRPGAETTSVCFSQLWRLGGPRPGSQHPWALPEPPSWFPAHGGGGERMKQALSCLFF